MAYITVQEANAWTDHSKLNLTTLDSELEKSAASQVLAEASQAFDVSSWSDLTNTPSLICKIIAMWYVAWYYERTYSEDTTTSDYGLMLMTKAEDLLEKIISGKILLTDIPTIPSAVAEAGSVSFLATEPVFSMGQIW